MASMTITTSFLRSSRNSATYDTTSQPSAASRRGGGLLVVRASKDEPEKMALDAKDRRGLMFAVTAMALCSVAKVAMADEPKRGTPEAKQKYAPVCVTNPTARICRY